MANMNALDLLVTELDELSGRIQAAVTGIRKALTEAEPEKITDETAEEKHYTLEEVRAVLIEKRKAGFRDEVKALLIRHGAGRLTEIDPGEYDSIMREVGSFPMND